MKRQTKNCFPCSTRVRFLSAGDVYEWEDLFDREVTIWRQNVKAYNLPSVLSSPVRYFAVGSTIVIHTYLYSGGVCWIGYYDSAADYANFNSSWIPLIGSVGTIQTIPVETITSTFAIDGVMTQAEEDAAAAAEAEAAGIGGAVTKAVKYIATAILGGLVISAIVKRL